jgi:hypothetical protein
MERKKGRKRKEGKVEKKEGKKGKKGKKERKKRKARKKRVMEPFTCCRCYEEKDLIETRSNYAYTKP